MSVRVSMQVYSNAGKVLSGQKKLMFFFILKSHTHTIRQKKSPKNKETKHISKYLHFEDDDEDEKRNAHTFKQKKNI